jgi:hypothetical protein
MTLFIVFVVSVVAIVWVFKMVRDSDDKAARAFGQRAIDEIPGFHPTVVFLGGDGLSTVAIDTANQDIAVVRQGTQPRVFGYNELSAVEVVTDNHSVARTDRGGQAVGAAVGGLMFGPAGAIIGGLSGGSSTTQKASKIAVKLYTTDMQHPLIEVVFKKFSVPIPVNSPGFQSFYVTADEWYGRFRAIMHEQHR